MTGKLLPCDIERVAVLDFDEPDAFERWWQGYKHKNRELANYSMKKCIAFDAFHEAMQQARASIAAMPTLGTGQLEGGGPDAELLRRAELTAYRWREDKRGFDAKLIEELVAEIRRIPVAAQCSPNADPTNVGLVSRDPQPGPSK